MLLRILLIGLVLESLLFLWLLGISRQRFIEFAWTPDTSSYMGVAKALAASYKLTATPRTLGYPLFASVGYFVGGETYGPYVVIAMQLLLNLGFTWLGWRLLERIAPDIATRQRVLVTAILFWAGLGMAALLITDLLAGLCFAIFLYGLLFWRDWRGAFVAGSALGVATLTRPSLTFVPVFLPVAAYLVRQITSRIPPAQVLIFAAFSIAATSVSLMYQYTFNQYKGPSPLLMVPIQEMLYHGLAREDGTVADYATFQRQFASRIEQRAGRPFDTVSLADREAHAKALFREALAAHPIEIGTVIGINALKYLVAPIESMVSRISMELMSAAAYGRYVRPLIAAVCLPIFLLSLAPPVRHPREHRMYYGLIMIFLIYIIGFSAIGYGSGERIRFPMLAFMAPVALWNARSLCHVLQARFGVPRPSTAADRPSNERAS